MTHAIGSSPASSVIHAPRRAAPILRTAFALLSVQGITWATTLVSVLVVPRYLGADLLGAYAAIITAATLITLAAGFGTTNEIVKQVARDPSVASDIVLHAIAVRMAIWLIAVLGAAGIALAFGASRLMVIALVLTLVGSGIGLIVAALQAGLQGGHSLGRAAILGAVVGVATQIAVIAVVVSGRGIVALGLVGVGSYTAVLGFTTWLFIRKFGHSVTWSFPKMRALAVAGLPFLAWEAALSVYGGSDYLVLTALANSANVGNYAFAYRLSGIPIFVATIVTAAVYPALAEAAGKDDAWFRRVLTNSCRVVLIVSLPMATGLAVLAPQLTEVVGGHGNFTQAAPLLAILAFHVPLAGMHSLLGTSLFARDRQRMMAVVAWGAAALNPLLNLAAIPLAGHLWSNGAIGAATITCVTEIFMGFWVWRAVGSDVDRRVLASVGARAAIACALMAAVVALIVPSIGIYPSVIAGAAVYGVLSLSLRTVSLRDLGDLRPGPQRDLAALAD